ncbi:endonuclease domain-containing protein [Pelagerythrobacter sp.]|uniref:endonuclease domain-containing protein n=1 Tax=Pelagerythrobacter sp. TaxID=2800702 RepID=UPI0035B03E03
MNRPTKPARTVQRARRLRREMTLPEVLLWQQLRGSPQGIRFRKQHPAGGYILDFFCARANLAIEVDGIAHDMGDRPQRDAKRDAWLAERRIETRRIPADDVLNDPVAVAENIIAMANIRMAAMGKVPPSSLCDATSPSQADGESRGRIP